LHGLLKWKRNLQNRHLSLLHFMSLTWRGNKQAFVKRNDSIKAQASRHFAVFNDYNWVAVNSISNTKALIDDNFLMCNICRCISVNLIYRRQVSLASPPVTILALNLKTVVNPKTHQNEITLISGLVHQVREREVHRWVQWLAELKCRSISIRSFYERHLAENEGGLLN